VTGSNDGAKPLGGLASGIALSLTMFVEAVGYGMVAPTLPFMARRVGASERGIGLLIGLYAAVGLVAVIPLSALANRYGRRSLVLPGLVCLTFASLGFVVAPTYAWLVGARLVQGLAASAIWVGALTIAADLSPSDSMGQSLSWITGAWSLGFVVGPALGGLGDVHTPFIVYAALSSAALLTAVTALKEVPGPRPRATSRGILAVLRMPAVLASAAATFTLSFYYGLVEAFLPLLVSQAGAERLTIGLLFVIAGLPSIVLPRIIGQIADRIGDVQLIVFGLFFAAALMALFLPLFHAAPHWLAFLLVGMVEVFVYLPAVALLNREIDSDRRIFATASHNYAFSAGFFLGPVLGGLVIPIGGFRLMFGMVTAVLLAGAAFVALASRKLPTAVPPASGPP
jgi:predicted MFS family arabinose efflux permease